MSCPEIALNIIVEQNGKRYDEQGCSVPHPTPFFIVGENANYGIEPIALFNKLKHIACYSVSLLENTNRTHGRN